MTSPKPKSRLRSFLRCAAAVVLLPLAIGGLYYGKWALVDHRLVTITPGTVYQSAAIPADEIGDTIRDNGIKTVIDLREDERDLMSAEQKAVDAAGSRYLNVPMPVEPSAADVDAFLAAMATAERPVLVHCQHGEGRSVLMCAIHRIQNEGWSNQGAFAGSSRLPDGLRWLSQVVPALGRFKPDSTKGHMVLDYVKKPAAEERPR